MFACRTACLSRVDVDACQNRDSICELHFLHASEANRLDYLTEMQPHTGIHG